MLRHALALREEKRDRVIVIVVTPGGDADAAYRAGMCLHHAYEHVTICVSGWCKSAGTLLAIAGHDLLFGHTGELGPLDVQIRKRDDLGGDRDSGLILNEALERLRDESFGIFENFMIRLMVQSQNNVTFRTAADIAAQMTIGLMQPVFDKIDPIRMGADARAMNIGQEYAVRLNLRAKNLRGDEALNMLLNGYPSHSFAIDIVEAGMLFTRVKPLEGQMEQVIASLEEMAIEPRAEGPAICYLDGVDDGQAVFADPDDEPAAPVAGSQAPDGPDEHAPEDV